MSSYTCISCRVAFCDGEVQRSHYKTDWHRYNLKRKVADMPPVSSENFAERVLAQRAATAQQENGAAVSEGCATCNKKFSSTNAYQNHLQSHKHQQAEKQALRAAQRTVERMNEKNLEKGLAEDGKEDHDARNAALQQVLKEQQRPSPAARSPAGVEKPREKPDKPPRLQWFEDQAKKMAELEVQEQEGAEAEEEEWEDVGEDDDMEDDDEDEEECMDQESRAEGTVTAATPPSSPAGAIPVTDCLFCPHHSHSLMKNLAHMTKVHSFFIPDLEYLIDLRGFLRYLGEKVGTGNVCLWCNEKGRSFYSTMAVQGHMTDKSHCKLFTDGDASLEFADYYDFRSSYPDQEDVEAEDEELPDDKNVEYDDDTLELTLPSGAKIGHRSLMRYYKQRFGAPRTLAVARNQNAVGRVLRQYRALGWGGDSGKASCLGQKDMRYVQKMKSKWMMKMGMNHNTTKQHHFRCQVMF